MSKLRVAVIGSGQVARTSHINHYKSLPDVEVSAVCDVNQEAAKMAAEGGFDYFATTLTISPLKNAQKLNEIGEELSELYKVEHLPSDFKKKNGYKRSVELSALYGLYWQNYCGCVFSKRDAEERLHDS